MAQHMELPMGLRRVRGGCVPCGSCRRRLRLSAPVSASPPAHPETKGPSLSSPLAPQSGARQPETMRLPWERDDDSDGGADLTQPPLKKQKGGKWMTDHAMALIDQGAASSVALTQELGAQTPRPPYRCVPDPSALYMSWITEGSVYPHQHSPMHIMITPLDHNVECMGC
eukprot:9490751-Pyramimonas_sp.AAC.1